MNKDNTFENGIGIGTVLSAVVFGVAVTLILFLIGAVLVYFTPLGDRFTEVFVLVATIFGIFARGFLSVRKQRSRGWLRGGAAGIIYALVIFIASAFCTDASLLKLAVSAVISFICGSVGGILGINIKK